MNEGMGAPVFLMGTGRCGSTIIYSCLSMHPDFAWISSWLTVAPKHALVATANRLWRLPGTDRFRETRFFPKPVEPNSVFGAWVGRFRDEQVTTEALAEGRQRLAPLIERLVRYQGGKRFLAKLVGRPTKIEYFAKLFPQAYFVHITRELRPTVSSLMQVEFYRGDQIANWPWGEIPQPYLDCYARSGKAEEVAAGIRVKLNLIQIRRQLAQVDHHRWMELPYAEFIREPVPSLQKVATLIGLPVKEDFLGRIRSRKLFAGADEKWKQYFTEEQKRNLDLVDAIG